MRWPWVSRQHYDRLAERVDRIEYDLWEHSEPDLPLGVRLTKLPRSQRVGDNGHAADHELVNEAMRALAEKGVL